jgi:phospholipase/carboxylesterase
MKQKKKLLILFHGYGSDGKDLEPIGTFIKENIPNIDFISPNGFEICNANSLGFQWFHLSEDRQYIFSEDVKSASIRAFQEFVIHQVKSRDIEVNDVILCGFSQGGMLALSIGLSMPDKPFLVICLSGLLLDNINISGKDQPNILILHGEDDNVLPIDYFNQTLNKLRKLDINFNYKSFKNLSHSISFKELEYLVEYLKVLIKDD